MKRKKGFTLVEVIVVLALLAIVGGFMGNTIIMAMRTSIRNQMINEASLLGAAARDYLEEELKYATKIVLSNSAPSSAYPDTDPDSYHYISNLDITGPPSKWLQRKLATPVQLWGGLDINPGTEIIIESISKEEVVDEDDNSATVTHDALEIEMNVLKGNPKTVLFTDTFMIKNINNAEITGPDSESVAALIKEQHTRLWTLIDQAEVDRQSSNARKYADRQFMAAIEQKFGISLSIPEGYHRNNPAGNPDNFMWFGYDTNFASMGIFIYSYPYTDTAQFSQKALNAKREELLKAHVPSSREGSYMITNPFVEPEYTPLTYKGTFLGRLRGLWEVHNGYMGGPFVSYSMVVNGNIVTVEGYVYAPKTEKRNYVRQVVGILLTMLPEKQEETEVSPEK